MDRAVLDGYGWTDIQTARKFILWHQVDDDEGNHPPQGADRYRWPDSVGNEVLNRLHPESERRS